MAWPTFKAKRIQPSLKPTIGTGLERLEARTVLSADVGALVSNLTGTAGLFMIDASDSMNAFRNLDINGDGALTNLDDVNGDGIKGSALDQSLDVVINLIQNRQVPSLMTLILFGADAKPMDMSPDPGIQAVGPTYADANDNGTFDSIEMLRSIRIGGGGLFAETRINPSRSFYSSPLTALLDIVQEYPNVTFQVRIDNTAPTIPIENPDPGTGTTIDNDANPTTVGYFSMQVQDGGSANVARVTAQGVTQLFTDQNFLFSFINGVDVDGAGAIPLTFTNITQAATRDPSGEDIVTSAGNFTGQNGQIDWTTTTSIADGSNVIVNTVTFSSANPFGNLQFGNYLDEDVGASLTTNILAPFGTPGQPGFSAFTLDGTQRVGFGQGGVYTPNGTTLVNATYDGWAADEYNDLITDLGNGTATFSVPGNIDTTDLPPFNDPALGPVYGPADVTSAFAWTLNPNALTATVTTFLTLIPSNPVTTFAGGLLTDGSGVLPTSNAIINALAARNLDISTFLAGHYFEVGSLQDVERIANGTGGFIYVPTTPVIVDNAAIAPTIPANLIGTLPYQIVPFTIGATFADKITATLAPPSTAAAPASSSQSAPVQNPTNYSGGVVINYVSPPAEPGYSPPAPSTPNAQPSDSLVSPTLAPIL